MHQILGFRVQFLVYSQIERYNILWHIIQNLTLEAGCEDIFLPRFKISVGKAVNCQQFHAKKTANNMIMNVTKLGFWSSEFTRKEKDILCHENICVISRSGCLSLVREKGVFGLLKYG